MSNTYHPKFIKYMNDIINHPNYKELTIKYKTDNTPVWVATKKSIIGLKRKEWPDKKAIFLGFEKSSKKYADTMFAIHPTKKKVCQCCGETMDLHYIYPTKNTIKYFQKNFNYTFNKYHSIYDIVDQLPDHTEEIKHYLISKGSLDEKHINSNINTVIEATELACRMGNKHIFSPGAMSNFPDRFDGFHSYNLCCRQTKDKGRHPDNMATYTKDRRAYEYWSDGNIAAANQLMHNPTIFKGMSADHIGPISLGFIHDPHYLQPMSFSDNSAKRDRLYEIDIKKIISIENSTGISPTSFFATEIWEFIKTDYLNYHTLSFDQYRDILKQNMINFMESLWILLTLDSDSKVKNFLIENIFTPKYEKYFKYKYEFYPDGSIKQKYPRPITDSAKDEFNRFTKVSFQSVDDFHSKINRNNHSTISECQKNKLIDIQSNIMNSMSNDVIFQKWTDYILTMQQELLHNITHN